MTFEQRVGPALGKIASGLYVITAQVNGAPVGMLCSFVEQAGFAPPMISLAIAPERPITPALEGAGVFGLHILGKENRALMKSFARGGTPESFAAHELVANDHGVPQFAEAWAFLVGQVRGHVPSGDHILYVAEILEGALQQAGGEPMIRIRANGFGY
jgi:flavin reductase (DIM6/NTAB) family NADH-FMN oxidoreductase RutF